MPSPITDLQNATALSSLNQKKEASGDLGKDDFLKLLVGQLSHQDPMNPMEDKDFMGQLAQFSQLEQMTNVAATLQNERSFNLIGKTVTYTDKDTGEDVTGKVEKVAIDGTTTSLTIAGKSGVKPEAITEVKA